MTTHAAVLGHCITHQGDLADCQECLWAAGKVTRPPAHLVPPGDLVCDAIEEAENLDEATPLEQAQALAADIDRAGSELQQDFNYPVDAHGRPMLLNQLHPDLVPCLVYHLIRCGWRKDPTKRMVKQRKVIGSVFADLVAYVPLTDPDDPIVAPAPVKATPWSVRPKFNDIHEKRPSE